MTLLIGKQIMEIENFIRFKDPTIISMFANQISLLDACLGIWKNVSASSPTE